MAPDSPSAESMTRGSNNSRVYFPDIWPRRAGEIARAPGGLPVFFAGHVRFFLLVLFGEFPSGIAGIFCAFYRLLRLRSSQSGHPSNAHGPQEQDVTGAILTRQDDPPVTEGLGPLLTIDAPLPHQSKQNSCLRFLRKIFSTPSAQSLPRSQPAALWPS